MPEPVQISLWGPSGAGKTLYLTQLYLAQTEQSDWRVFIDVAPSDAGSSSQPPQGADDPFIRAGTDSLLANRFPRATDPGTGVGLAVRYIFKHRRTDQTASLYARDRAGADWLTLDKETEEQLRSAAALVLLFDAESPDLQAKMRQAFERLSRLRRAAGGAEIDNRPVAVCLSKADQHLSTSRDLVQATGNPREFVFQKMNAGQDREINEKGLPRWIDTYCSKFEFFPVSSVGVLLSHGCIEKLWFLDEDGGSRIATRPRPINLMKPLEWIFSQTAASA